MDSSRNQSETSWQGISPAKVNLYLAVTGKRSDGFHEIVSLVSKVAWGDDLHLRFLEPSEKDRCVVDDPACPSDDRNLAMQAVKAFRERVPDLPPVSIDLKKRIPIGAGLGGGSSNASTCLSALNCMMGSPLEREALLQIAAGLGSDCPVFLTGGPTWMRGRGEVLTPASGVLVEKLREKPLTIIAPPFSVETPWAYGRLAERGEYWDPEWAERDASLWNEDPEEALNERMFNSFDGPLKEKFLAYLALFRRLNSMGARPMISGSGSSCFFFSDSRIERNAIDDVIRDSWGEDSILSETFLA
ncbi:MAG: 4-(cytidine 5'-diphospho)-2-C-methyl-D-erythritol kinase [Verrucomicrobiota bacterium]